MNYLRQRTCSGAAIVVIVVSLLIDQINDFRVFNQQKEALPRETDGEAVDNGLHPK